MNLFGFDIRSVRPADSEQLVELFGAVNASAIGDDSVILVAEDSAFRRLVGFVALTAHGGAAAIDRLSVQPHARRQGVGRMLVREAARWAATRNADRLELADADWSADARAFWQAMRQGASESGVRSQ
jgi:GNAT superfamily N-acetyltransferase